MMQGQTTIGRPARDRMSCHYNCGQNECAAPSTCTNLHHVVVSRVRECLAHRPCHGPILTQTGHDNKALSLPLLHPLAPVEFADGLPLLGPPLREVLVAVLLADGFKPWVGGEPQPMTLAGVVAADCTRAHGACTFFAFRSRGSLANHQPCVGMALTQGEASRQPRTAKL
jgi:hypothetical protein